MLAARWRLIIAVICLAVTGWATVVAGGNPLEWFLLEAILAGPVLLAAALSPGWRSGTLISALLLAALVGLVLASTRWPNALRPPQTDWAFPYLAVALVACAAAYTLRVVQAPPERRPTLLGAGVGAIVVLLCLGAIIANGPGGVRPGSGNDVSIDRANLKPWPAALDIRILGTDCKTGTGVCTQVIEVYGRTKQPTNDVTTLLTQHLRSKGWPMTDRIACLPIRGVLHWADRACAAIVPADDLAWAPGAHPHDNAIVLILSAEPGAILHAPA